MSSGGKTVPLVSGSGGGGGGGGSSVGGVTIRRKAWKCMEIPAARLSCLTSGSFRPKLGICILASVILGFVILVVVPYSVRYFPSVPPPATQEPFSLQRRILSPQKMARLVHETVEANDKTTSDLLHVLGAKDENLIMSAFSVGVVMSMLAAGAKGQSRQQILNTFHHRDLADAADSFSDLVSSLKGRHDKAGNNGSSSYTLKVANGLFTERTFGLSDEYSKYLNTYYNVTPKAMDFAGDPEASRKAINAIVQNQTTIKDLLPGLDPLTKLVLINSLYFKGQWLHPFNAEETRKADFHVDARTKVKVQMMSLKAKLGMARLEGEGASVLRLPYKGQPEMDMVVVLPDEGVRLQDVEEKLTSSPSLADALDAIDNDVSGNRDDVIVEMPKFRVESELELNEPLKALGVTDVFDPEKADLSAISGGGSRSLHLSLVIQKAFVEVDEAGSEAAAASAAILVARSGFFGQQKFFICDRPFHFMIRQRVSGLVLFSGRVIRP